MFLAWRTNKLRYSKGKKEEAKQNRNCSSLCSHNMPSAQDPFYVVKAEIQDSVFLPSTYLGLHFSLIRITIFNFHSLLRFHFLVS